MKENRQTLARTAKIGDYIVVECEGGCHAPAGINLPYDPDEFVYFDNANFVVGRVEKPYFKYDGNKAPTPFGPPYSSRLTHPPPPASPISALVIGLGLWRRLKSEAPDLAEKVVVGIELARGQSIRKCRAIHSVPLAYLILYA
jgi:hypothetical protein